MTHLYRFAYLFGCALLALAWVFIYRKRPDLRKSMLWASLAGTPFGFIDFLLVPRYWHPDSLFGLMPRFGIGIESFVFLFFMSGVAASIYEFSTGRHLVRDGHKKHHIATVVIAIIVFIAAHWIFGLEAIYAFISAGLVGEAVALAIRQDLAIQMAYVSIIFGGIYGLVFFLTTMVFPGFVEAAYNLGNLSGIFILGIPIEEILAAFFLGGFWSTTYEIAKGYRLRK